MNMADEEKAKGGYVSYGANHPVCTCCVSGVAFSPPSLEEVELEQISRNVAECLKKNPEPRIEFVEKGKPNGNVH